MNVLIVGGSGFIGTHLTSELLDRGHDVTVLSRSPEDEDLPAGVETVRGDVTAYDSIEGAFAGKDAVVYLVSLSPLFKPKGGDERHFEVHTEGTRHVVQAAEEHGVGHIVHMSGLGADLQGPTAFLRAKGQAEEIVRDSALEWTIFRPSVVFGEGGEFVGFTKKLKGMFAPGVPIYPLPGGGETRFQPIWVGDLVPMLADAVEGTSTGSETEPSDDEHVGKTYDIGGPEKLTLREITNMVYEAEGKSINIVSIPMGLAGVGLKLGGAIPGFPMGGDQYRSLQVDNTTGDNDVAAFGVSTAEMKTLGEYLETTA